MRIDKSLAEEIMKKALGKGADLAEVFMISSRSTTVEVKSQEVDAFEESDEFGYSLRILKNGCPGFSYSTTVDDRDDVVDNALESSRFTGEDRFLDFAEPSTYSLVEIYDPAVPGLTGEECIERVMKIEDAALGRDPRIKRVRKASGTFSSSELLLINSKGLEGLYSSTSVTAQIEVLAENGEDAQIGWAYDNSRFLDDIDFEMTGREAADRALRLLGARKGLTGKGYVLLESPVAAEFLSVLASSLSSENIQKGKSILIGKRGKRIVSERLNITDNALMRGRTGSRPFDAEGTPSKENRLVREGILLNYLYNIYTARKEKIPSTGNAVRGGIKNIPGVGISNLYVTANSDNFVHKYKDLVRMIDRGLVITEAMGVHTANPVTGEFSVGITGLCVEGGEIKYPVKEAAISGNMLELFSKVAGVSNNLRFYGKIGAPDVLIEDVDISG
jgi:PmbA protein